MTADDLDLVHVHAPGTPAVVAAGYREQVEAVARLRAERDALAAALEDIAGMLDWNRLQPNTPPDWRATGECAGMNHVCHEAHPDDPGEWCPTCVAEICWSAWKMGTLA